MFGNTFVSSKLNPADFAARGILGELFSLLMLGYRDLHFFVVPIIYLLSATFPVLPKVLAKLCMPKTNFVKDNGNFFLTTSSTKLLILILLIH